MVFSAVLIQTVSPRIRHQTNGGVATRRGMVRAPFRSQPATKQRTVEEVGILILVAPFRLQDAASQAARVTRER